MKPIPDDLRETDWRPHFVDAEEFDSMQERRMLKKLCNAVDKGFRNSIRATYEKFAQVVDESVSVDTPERPPKPI
jgi:hypothetical protein